MEKLAVIWDKVIFHSKDFTNMSQTWWHSFVILPLWEVKARELQD